MEKGNEIQKRKKGEEKHNIPRARKCRTTGPVAASTDANDGDNGAHDQDANAKSGEKGGEVANWRSNRLEEAREVRPGAAVQRGQGTSAWCYNHIGGHMVRNR
jgi:hypothetical protein